MSCFCMCYVTMSTGEIYDAELVGEDEASDLALLKIKPDENVKFSYRNYTPT